MITKQSAGLRGNIRSIAQTILSKPIYATLVSCLVVVLLGEMISPGFASWRQLSAQMTVASILALVAAGQGIVILSGREGIDLSLGSTMSLCALVAGNVMSGQDAMILPALLAAIACGFGVGLFNGLGITVVRIAPLVMTLGTAGVVTGLLVVLTQGQTSGSAAPVLVEFISRPFFLGVPGIIFVWGAVIVGLFFVFRNTRFGFCLYAIGSNDMAAAFSGVRVRYTRALAYAVSGAFAGLGGYVLLGYTGTVFVGAGEQYVLPSVIAAVIGGTSLAGGKGTYTGTAAGALFLVLLTALLTSLSMSPADRQIVFGCILILFMIAYGRE